MKNRYPDSYWSLRTATLMSHSMAIKVLRKYQNDNCLFMNDKRWAAFVDGADLGQFMSEVPKYRRGDK